MPWIQLPVLFGEGSLCAALLVTGVNSTRWKVLGFIAEASLMLWLVVMGVNSERWIERATAAEYSTPVNMQVRRESI